MMILRYNTFLLILVVFIKANYAQVSDEEYGSMPDLFHQDNFDKCMLLKDQAFYCSFTYQLEPLDRSNPPEVWGIIQKVINASTNYRHDKLRHSICVPHTCPNVSKASDDDPKLWKGIQDCYNSKFSEGGFKGKVIDMSCDTQYSKYPIDWLDIICGVVFVGYVVFVFYATYYEGVARYESKEVYNQLMETPKGKLLSAFSITKNWIRLKTVNSTKEVEKLRCIQGMRLYNTCLVVMSHTALSLIGPPVANTKYPESMHQNPGRLIFSSGPICVGTFFLFSTFLLSNGLFDYLKDKKEMNMKMIVFAIFNRFFRLTPTVLVVVLFHATWLRHLSSGPKWNEFVGYEFLKCRANGWTNILYINNWYDTYVMCVPVTWYLALDTQYFVMALFLIKFLKANEKHFSLIIGTILGLTMIASFCQNYYYDFSALILPVPEFFYGIKDLLGSFQFHYQVGSFIGNISPATIGIAFGYYFYKHKYDEPDQYIFRTKFRQGIWWIMTFITAFLYLIITGSIILNVETEHNAFWASVYVAVSRPLFAFIIGLGVIGFTEGIGWIALRVVQWSPTYVLGRLTFSVYLIHMSVNLVKPGMARFPTYASDSVLFITFLGDIALIYILATILALLVELPVSQLQKQVFSFEKVKKTTTDKEE
ncbi:O-acyltransferase like protein-like [Sitophilus oryzae]|uniref:O-acyltransferase like protein-like n=1 Tax=Sitophilus oryzae TaxID=7048 RepID=A0A6J2YVH8_SITOR|nr:O-acyltransferase like protein-like [Sitophilus oryzae]